MTLAHWRDIAILILVIEALLCTVLVMVLTLVLAGIVRRSDAALRGVLQSGRAHAAGIAAQTDGIARDQIVTPVVRLHAAGAGARAFVRCLARNVPFPQR